jgi:hypothetical protein
VYRRKINIPDGTELMRETDDQLIIQSTQMTFSVASENKVTVINHDYCSSVVEKVRASIATVVRERDVYIFSSCLVLNSCSVAGKERCI